MFYYLNGELALRDINMCVIDCGGVGYKLTVSRFTSDSLVNKLGEKVKLYTHLAVREDGIEFFGFGSNEERVCFNRLITVSGVGPKAALSILSIMTPDDFSLAVCTEDAKSIAKAPGIGPKTAARIVLDLKDKVSKEMMVSGAKVSGAKIIQATVKSPIIQEAVEALMVIGFDKNSAIAALNDVDPSINDVGEIIKFALKKLAK
jgi:Holliday junction DNA helicase RuvA